MEMNQLRDQLRLSYSEGDDTALAGLADTFEEDGQSDIAELVRQGHFWEGWHIAEWPPKDIDFPDDGWWVCECDTSPKYHRLCTLTQFDRFEADGQVWAYVWYHALISRRLDCASALAFIWSNCSTEKRAIQSLMSVEPYQVGTFGISLVEKAYQRDDFTRVVAEPGDLVKVIQSNTEEKSYSVRVLTSNFQSTPAPNVIHGYRYGQIKPVQYKTLS